MSSPVAEIQAVLINGAPIGIVAQHENGSLGFSYDPAYAGIPLSLSMPVANVDYGDKVVRPYLFGLLPEDRGLRRSLGAELGVSGNNPFALLKHVGYDCAGAVQIIPAEESAGAPISASRYTEVEPSTIGERLASISRNGSAVWQLHAEHWSLGGQQSKIALARFGETWYECEGAAATTHIIKPGITTLSHQALNEHLCLRLATLCGLPAARSSFMRFGSMPAIVVERYDRIVIGSNEVKRLHQEDLCQALSILPENKYAGEGGPSTHDIMTLLGKHPGASSNKEAFAAQLFFNYLAGAPDGHAKNHSVLLHDKTGPILSPLYDVASGLPYEHPHRRVRTALSIGGENRIGMLKRHHVQRFSEAARLDETRMLDLALNLADAILASLPELEQEANSLEGGRELAERLIPALRALNEQTVKELEG